MTSLPLSPLQPSKTILFRHKFSPPSIPPTPTKLPPLSSSLWQTPIRPQTHPHLQPLPLSDPDDNPNYSNDHGHDRFLLSHRCLHLLRIAALRSDVRLGRPAHASVAKSPEDTFVTNAVIAMYAKLGLLADAQAAFDQLTSPDVVSYTTLVSAYAKQGRELDAVRLFLRMQDSGVEPNGFTYVGALTACTRCGDLQLGSQIHAAAVKSRYVASTYVSNAIMALYVKSGHAEDAVRVFDEMMLRDVASWNTVISGLLQDLQHERAFELFRDMQVGGVRADQYTLSSLLAASMETLDWRCGKEVHAHALRIGLESDVCVNNALIGFHTKCGSIHNVVGLFQRMPTKDVFSWTEMVTAYMEFGLVESAVETFHMMPQRNYISYNALLAGFCKNGEGSRALECFLGMLEDEVELSDFTLTIIVNACALLSDLDKSKQVHGFVIKVGFGSNSRIETALLDMCTKCDRMHDAWKMFSQLEDCQSRSVAWTSLICGYAQKGQPQEAMLLFSALQAVDDVLMDEVTLATILAVCGTLGFYNNGKQIHCHVLKSDVLSDLAVHNATISMYAKCGNMKAASEIFNLMPEHDTVSWNALIAGYLLHREGDQALGAWKKMKENGVRPDHITFQAEELINSMPSKPNALVWRALLDSCRLRSNISLGRQAVQHLLALEIQDTSTYVLVSNLYSASGRWHCAEKVRQEMREKGLNKLPARSWIIHENSIQSFHARDKFHLQTKDIYSGLDILILECMKAGYVPDTSVVLHEVEEYQKKDFLFYHSAKLAVTFGLLKTVPGSFLGRFDDVAHPLRVVVPREQLSLTISRDLTRGGRANPHGLFPGYAREGIMVSPLQWDRGLSKRRDGTETLRRGIGLGRYRLPRLKDNRDY
ncbi:hypothetical protein ACLOJK_020917 [Asimina triloba]